jgi:hypothetical protein
MLDAASARERSQARRGRTPASTETTPKQRRPIHHRVPRTTRRWIADIRGFGETAVGVVRRCRKNKWEII